METPQVEIGKSFSWAWETLKKEFWYFVILILLVIIIPSLVNGADMNNGFFNFLGLLLSVWMTCGITRILLDYYRGNKRKVQDLFTQVKPFWNVRLATILLGIIIFIGLIFLIIPGIYLGLKYMFTTYFIIDKNMGISEAMKKSAEMTDGKKMDLFLFGLTGFGVVLLGAICLGVGVFVALPVVYLASIYLYMNLVGEKQTAITASEEIKQ